MIPQQQVLRVILFTTEHSRIRIMAFLCSNRRLMLTLAQAKTVYYGAKPAGSRSLVQYTQQ